MADANENLHTVFKCIHGVYEAARALAERVVELMKRKGFSVCRASTGNGPNSIAGGDGLATNAFVKYYCSYFQSPDSPVITAVAILFLDENDLERPPAVYGCAMDLDQVVDTDNTKTFSVGRSVLEYALFGEVTMRQPQKKSVDRRFTTGLSRSVAQDSERAATVTLARKEGQKGVVRYFWRPLTDVTDREALSRFIDGVVQLAETTAAEAKSA